MLPVFEKCSMSLMSVRLCVYVPGVATLLLKVQETNLGPDSVDVDLSSLTRFTDLKKLWAVGYTSQRYVLTFNGTRSVTSLPIEHLHIYMRHGVSLNVTTAFTQLLVNLQTVDIMNYVFFEETIFLSPALNYAELQQFQLPCLMHSFWERGQNKVNSIRSIAVTLRARSP